MIEPFARRRLRHITLLMVISVVVGAGLLWQRSGLGGSGYPSGYGLLAAVLLLAAYRLRKRWVAVSWLGRSATWLQFHIYLGWFTLGLFWIHVDFNWPSGWLEQILATVFLMITASGVYGLYVTRTYPKKLTAVGREVIFEQIPVQRRQLIRQAESLALEVGYQSDIIAEFIARRLLPFLIRERSWSYLAFPNGKARRGLLSEVESLKRYLAADQHAETLRLRHLIQAKDDLDYHHALQGRLKGWLFLHVCLTGVLIGLALVHTLVVHVFQGGL